MLAALFDLIFPPREDEILVRTLSEAEVVALMAPSKVAYTVPEAVALLPFHNPRIRALTHEAKYHGSEAAFTMLASVLSEYLLEHNAEEGFGKSVLIPVPLSRERRKSRGFNQVEEITRRAIREGGLTLRTDLLVKTRDTGSQIALPRAERKENLRGAFSAAEVLDPSCTYLLIDDVVTTGATLQSAIDALRAGGAERVIPLALAH